MENEKKKKEFGFRFKLSKDRGTKFCKESVIKSYKKRKTISTLTIVKQNPTSLKSCHSEVTLT